MKFKLSCAASWVDEGEKRTLEKLGFRFVSDTKSFLNRPWYKDYKAEPEIELATLEDLMRFVRKYGTIVLDEEGIELYNDYRE